MIGHRPLVPEDYLGILKRRWWIILIPLLILPMVSYAFSYLIPPRYMSQTLVLIEGQKVPDSYVRSVVSTDLDSRLASMKEQILSRSHLQPIIERYNLYGSQHTDLDDRIDMVRKDIEIKPIHSEVAHAGGLPGFFITFKADDAHTAQLVCGDITSLFLNENLRLREQSAEGTTDFIKGQLNDAKHSLDEQDAKLAAFERQYIGRLPGQAASNSDMLSSLNTQLEAVTQQIARAEQDKSYMQAMLAQQGQATPLSSSNGTTTYTSVPSAAQQEAQSELQVLQAQEADLSSHYTSDYPDVIAIRKKIAEAKTRLAQAPRATVNSATSPVMAPSRESAGVQQLRAQLRAADVGLDERRKQQAQIQAQIGNYQARVESSPAVEEQYKQLTRDYQTAQGFYDDLLGKMNQANMATDLEKRQQGEQFRIMDEANLPDAPFSPKRGLFLGSGAAFGLALGLAIAGLIEFRDTTLRSERDVWHFTKLPTLGMVGFSQQAQDARPGVKRRLRLPFRRSNQVASAQG